MPREHRADQSSSRGKDPKRDEHYQQLGHAVIKSERLGARAPRQHVPPPQVPHQTT